MNILNSILTYFSYQQASELVIPIIIKAAVIIGTLIATSIITKLAKKSITNICKRRNIEKHSCMIFNKTTRYSIRIFALIFMLQNLGINVSALVTALGISGVAISFGMKDTISNIIAGILIMLYQQFKIGDTIKIKDWQGKVADINIRYTTVKTDDMTVFIPNSILYSATMAIVHDKEAIVHDKEKI